MMFFFFNDTATTEIYTLSLHDALPISPLDVRTFETIGPSVNATQLPSGEKRRLRASDALVRSEEHTSELQSQSNIVCRLLLEKKKTTIEHLLCLKITHMNSIHMLI